MGIVGGSDSPQKTATTCPACGGENIRRAGASSAQSRIQYFRCLDCDHLIMKRNDR